MLIIAFSNLIEFIFLLSSIKETQVKMWPEELEFGIFGFLHFNRTEAEKINLIKTFSLNLSEDGHGSKSLKKRDSTPFSFDPDRCKNGPEQPVCYGSLTKRQGLTLR